MHDDDLSGDTAHSKSNGSSTGREDPELDPAAEENLVPDATDVDMHDLIAQLQQEIATLKSDHLRATADFQNLRRRTEERAREERKYATREMLAGILPVLDNFERALAAAESTQSYSALVSGVELTLRQLQEYLKRHGVERIEAVGQEFDPELHEALMRVHNLDLPANTVVAETTTGYRLHDRVLRPTQVTVSTREAG